jgi:hypothetical protein
MNSEIADGGVAKAVRSVRNNNPGNIERGDPWQGLLPESQRSEEQRREDRFCVFAAPKWGFRALARTLVTYYDRHRKDTVRKIIRRWAPPPENDTGPYIEHVCRLTGFAPDQVLDLHAYEHAWPLAKAIAIHEAGGWFFAERDLDEGLRLAGIEPPAKPLSDSRTMRAAAAGGTASVAIATMAETIEAVDPALDLARRITDIWPLLACVVLLVALGAVAYFRYDDWRELKR